ncbi:MAG: MFS transporter [Candidatus Lokiarchaeota archaeon]|nr:MFS transporter [Candidatus Lokiarchaeota archaeon]MBD3198541.1 MFS transporter [Candidatus Lokiarchaeota archaeon]
MEETLGEFKTSYTAIFSVNYFVQGVSQSLFTAIVPLYLIIQIGGIVATDLASLGTVVLLPFAVKFIYGILSDKFALKKLGRRKPWIIGPLTLTGLIWIIIPLVITASTALALFTIGGFFIYLGIAMGDTAIDGLILDNCPKNRLGRVQGICWGFRSVGIIAGGPLLVLIFYIFSINIEWIFIGYGIFVVLTSLLVLLVEEFKTMENMKVFDNLKMVFGKGKNWKVFSFALFNAFVDGVIFLFISLFILSQIGLLDFSGGVINTSAIEESVTDEVLYGTNALINLILGGGVIIGAVIGGYLADVKSRTISVYSSFLVTTVSLLLFLINAHFAILLIFAFIVGSSNGWRNSGFSAVIGQISTLYPEVDSTYYATCNSFANIGTVLGLISTNIILGVLEGSAVTFIFGVLFIFMALASNLGAIPFLFMDKKEYELPEEDRD